MYTMFDMFVLVIRMQIKSIIMFLLTILSIFLAGCNETSVNNDNNDEPYAEDLIKIKNEYDDGSMVILSDYEQTYTGWVHSTGDVPAVCGLASSGGGDNLTSRIVFRFDLSSWNGEKLSFHAKCIDVYGNPGQIELYLINDTGSIPTNQENLTNISQYWLLKNNGIKISTVNGSKNKWIQIPLPYESIQKKISNDAMLCILLKIVDESRNLNEDFYLFSTYENTPNDSSDIAYLKK